MAVSLIVLHDHVDAWLLSSGIAAGGALVLSVLRTRLLEVAHVARGHRATFDAFFQNATIGLAYLDSDLRHVRVNDALAELTGRAAA